jgi:hypothetical protein
LSNDAASFIGSIPQRYDQGLGPTILVDFAADIAPRVAVGNPARVLETAAPAWSRESCAMHCRLRHA